MLDPPSDALQKVLKEHLLCSPRDLRKCRGAVLRLARDLPAFDSVWLDALVQTGRLTRYQARLLESPQRDRIGVGPCVLVDRIGGGPLGETCLARPKAGRTLCALKLLNASDKLTTENRARLKSLINQLQGFSHPSIAAPHTCHEPAGKVVLVSRYVDGPHLADLLVRRGRYPAAVVWEIGRQLTAGLAALAERKVSHGDIRLANVRLTRQGQAVLVDPGIRSAIDPNLTVHAALPPERFDGIAPELIGTGALPDARSDLYALGCLLWQLLAGRPPYPGGDPLAKLASHQTRKIEDVRKWAPDVPPLLAETLLKCTDRDPQRRPESFRAVLNVWGQPAGSGRRLLAAFRRRFDMPAPMPDRPRSKSTFGPFSVLTTALFAASGLAVVLSDAGGRAELAALASRVRQAWHAPVSQKLQPNASAPSQGAGKQIGKAPAKSKATAVATGRKLPAPDSQGVVLLSDNGPYDPAEISAVGSLVIRGKPGVKPTIVIEQEPLRVWAESLKLENVHLRCVSRPAGGGDQSTAALLLIHAQSVEISQCTFNGDASPAESHEAGPTLVGWKLLDQRDPRGGLATVRNSCFSGSGPALHLASSVQKLTCENCLKTGKGPLLHLAAPPGNRDPQIALTNLTLKSSGALVRWRLTPDWPGRRKLLIEANDCVFDILPGHTRLIELQGDAPRDDAVNLFKVGGEGSLGSEALQLAAWIDDRTGAVTPLDPGALDVSGIFAGPFRFAGKTLNPSDAVVQEYDAPRRSPHPPGIRLSALPSPW